jgi:hypothetical protein
VSVPQSKEEIIELIRTAAENEQKIEKFKSIIVELKNLYEEKLQAILGELKRFSKENQNLTEELKKARTRIVELERQVTTGASGAGGGEPREPTVEDLVNIRTALQRMKDDEVRALARERGVTVEDGWRKNRVVDAILLQETGVENADLVMVYDDVVSVLKTLDGLLEKLPEAEVKAFASSKEFALYDALCTRLKL